MKIERVLVFNLPKNKERRWFAEGTLWSLGFPRTQIDFVKCRHWADYQDVNQLRAAAVDDGFDFFMSGVNKERWGIPVASLPNTFSAVAAHWSWCIALRDIINAAKNTILLVDDTMPTITFAQFESMIEAIPPKGGVQLSMKPMIFDYGFPFGDITHATAYLGRGYAAASDLGFILSPAMAKDFLLISHTRRSSTVPLAYRDMYGTEGCFHVLSPVLSHHHYFSSDWKYD